MQSRVKAMDDAAEAAEPKAGEIKAVPPNDGERKGREIKDALPKAGQKGRKAFR
jgi:hypothetical protein